MASSSVPNRTLVPSETSGAKPSVHVSIDVLVFQDTFTPQACRSWITFPHSSTRASVSLISHVSHHHDKRNDQQRFILAITKVKAGWRQPWCPRSESRDECVSAGCLLCSFVFNVRPQAMGWMVQLTFRVGPPRKLSTESGGKLTWCSKSS